MRRIQIDEEFGVIMGMIKKLERKIDRLEILMCESLNREHIHDENHVFKGYLVSTGDKFKPSEKNTIIYPEGPPKKKKKTNEVPSLFDNIPEDFSIPDDEMPF